MSVGSGLLWECPSGFPEEVAFDLKPEGRIRLSAEECDAGPVSAGTDNPRQLGT